jgi:uncharacterized phage infection (PIP) family protein YhgE
MSSGEIARLREELAALQEARRAKEIKEKEDADKQSQIESLKRQIAAEKAQISRPVVVSGSMRTQIAALRNNCEDAARERRVADATRQKAHEEEMAQQALRLAALQEQMNQNNNEFERKMTALVEEERRYRGARKNGIISLDRLGVPVNRTNE